MAINLVRIPSDTPNISPADDCRMFKYAVGGVDGYIKGYGQECGYTVNGRVFTIQSGEIVADGYQVDIDSNGASITAISSSSTYYYTVYAEVDLRISDSPAVSIKSSYSLTEYPTVDIGDNLTVNSFGVHRVPLYRFKVQNGSISSVEKLIDVLPYTHDELETLKLDLSNTKTELSNTKTELSEDISYAESRISKLENKRLYSARLEDGDRVTVALENNGVYAIRGNLNGQSYSAILFVDTSMIENFSSVVKISGEDVHFEYHTPTQGLACFFTKASGTMVLRIQRLN